MHMHMVHSLAHPKECSLSCSYHLKRQTSKYSNICEPWLKPQATVWCSLACPIWPSQTKLSCDITTCDACALTKKAAHLILFYLYFARYFAPMECTCVSEQQ